MLNKLLFKCLLPSALFLYLLSISNVSPAQQPTKVDKEKSSFTAKLMNIEAATSEAFRYNTTLYNGSGHAAVYELKAELPAGWLVTYRVDGSQVTSINMDAGKTQDISIEINATAKADPGKYNIPVKAISANETLSLALEAMVKGFYELTLSTPSGRLSEEVTSGGHTEIQLTLKNPGTLPLNDLELSSQLPSGWEVIFEPSKIKQLEPGKSADIKATLKVPDKTIAGDYVSTLKASSSSSNAEAAFRIIVKTSLLSGWIGIIVILAAIGVVFYLIRKYGRR